MSPKSTILVEQCPRIDINTILSEVRKKLTLEILTLHMSGLGNTLKMTTTETRFGGERLWFQCPICDKKKSVLYQHPLSNEFGCRSCLNLVYKSQRYKGMLENKI